MLCHNFVDLKKVGEISFVKFLLNTAKRRKKDPASCNMTSNASLAQLITKFNGIFLTRIGNFKKITRLAKKKRDFTLC